MKAPATVTRSQLTFQLENLIDAARLIFERWESGDLADAVNSLRIDVEQAEVVLRRERAVRS